MTLYIKTVLTVTLGLTDCHALDRKLVNVAILSVMLYNSYHIASLKFLWVQKPQIQYLFHELGKIIILCDIYNYIFMK